MVDNQELRHALSEGTHLIGRADDAALKLVQPSVSRRHAEIIVNGTQADGPGPGQPQRHPAQRRQGGRPHAHQDRRRDRGGQHHLPGRGSRRGVGLSMFNESVTLVPSARD